MRRTLMLLAVFGLASLLFVMPLSALSQTKASGTLEGGKADLTYTIQIPEQKGSSYAIEQGKSLWTKSFTLAGIESTQNAGVNFVETMGDSYKGNGTGVTYYKNGDKTLHKGTFAHDPKTKITSWTWNYIGGTGKFQGIKGGGTSTCKMKSDDPGAGFTCEVKGEYTLPPAKK